MGELGLNTVENMNEWQGNEKKLRKDIVSNYKHTYTQVYTGMCKIIINDIHSITCQLRWVWQHPLGNIYMY